MADRFTIITENDLPYFNEEIDITKNVKQYFRFPIEKAYVQRHWFTAPSYELERDFPNKKIWIDLNNLYSNSQWNVYWVEWEYESCITVVVKRKNLRPELVFDDFVRDCKNLDFELVDFLSDEEKDRESPDLTEVFYKIPSLTFEEIRSTYGCKPTVSKVENNSHYPHKCPKCNGPAYIGSFFNNVDCSNKCGIK